jgi:hypothetical protein
MPSGFFEGDGKLPTKHIHVLQHSSINTLGTIEEYAKIKNHRLESTRFYETKISPTIDSFDFPGNSKVYF